MSPLQPRTSLGERETDYTWNDSIQRLRNDELDSVVRGQTRAHLRQLAEDVPHALSRDGRLEDRLRIQRLQRELLDRPAVRQAETLGTSTSFGLQFAVVSGPFP